MTMTKKIYLAGFDVFRRDARGYGKRLKELCERKGFEGLFPLDNEPPFLSRGPAMAQWIYEANTALIKSADLVMANLNPFRGEEPDSGTAFEVGFAVALGKPVWGYHSIEDTLVDRLSVNPGSPREVPVDANGYEVENFGLTHNLMLACSAKMVTGGPIECLNQIAEFYRQQEVQAQEGEAPIQASLRPCPFCGQDGKAIKHLNLTAIACTGCGAAVAQTALGADDAVDRWNRRAFDLYLKNDGYGKEDPYEEVYDLLCVALNPHIESKELPPSVVEAVEHLVDHWVDTKEHRQQKQQFGT